MKNQKKLHIVLFGLACILLVVSCSKNENTPKDHDQNDDAAQTTARSVLLSISFTDDNHTVPIEAAKALAFNLDKIMPPSTRLSKAGVALSIEKSFTINDSAGSPNMYVFDYTGDGFAVFSADERYNPVLAVVPNGKYEQCKNLAGITNWFGETMDYINLAKKGHSDPQNNTTARWRHVIDQINKPAEATSARSVASPMGCTYPTYTNVFVGMTTTWGQYCGYNDSLTYANIGFYGPCSVCSSNPNPPTGCVATAMAQVIKFWAATTPQNYNYANMPDNNWPADSSEVNRLMKDAGISASMNYTCGGSGTSLTSAQNGFLNTFGYSNVDRSYSGTSPINLPVLVSNITNGFPVILGGCSSSGDCHAWVCDGYEKLVSSCYTYYYLQMNWGWNGNGNGWYENNNWNSPYGTFSHHQKEMLYNILP